MKNNGHMHATRLEPKIKIIDKLYTRIMLNYIAKMFEFLFKPYWLREYLNDEAIEDIQNLETEGVEDDEYINIKYK